MWSPTHVQVVVQRARALPVKGKNGKNDAYVTIQLGKEKYQTSVKEKSENPEWMEECELTIPDGNTSCIILTVLHRNFVGLDKFIGQVQIPLNELEIYERARNRWYTLKGKPGKPDKQRGELEVKISFTVKSVTGSLLDLSKKPKKTNSLPRKMVQSVGGSLMNLAGKDKKLGNFHFKNLAKYGHKMSEKFPLKRSRSNRSTGKIDELSSEVDLEEDRISQMSSYNSDEEIAFGIEQLTDDVASTNEFVMDSPSEMTNQMPDDIIANPTVTDIPPVESTSLQGPSENHEETDEWQSKLLGIHPTEIDRRMSVPMISERMEPLLEADNVGDGFLPLRESSKKLRLGRNNVRRHTIQGIRSTKPLPELEEKEMDKVPMGKIPEVESSNIPVITVNHAPSAQSVRQNSVFSSSSKVEPKQPPSPQQQQQRVQHSPPVSPTVTKPTSPLKANASSGQSDAKNEKLHIKNSGLLSKLSREKVEMFEKMSKEDLVELIVCQQSSIDMHLRQIRELEDYIDNLLVQVMETTPRILQKSYRISPSVRNEHGFEDPKRRILRPCQYL